MLRGKTAVITGAKGGMGRAMLRVFAQNGADIFACARTGSDELEEMCKELDAQYGVSVTPLFFDITNEASVKEAAKKISAGKKADIIVNNAGVAHGGFFQMTPIGDIRAVFETNYFGQIHFTQSIVRLLVRQKSGSIINIASVSGLDNRSGNIAYGASKSALVLATKSMASELAPYGIRVNAIAPGIIKTGMYYQMEDKALNDMLSSAAMGRAGEPEEVANTALFLASDLSSYITGQIIRVDGGMN